MCSFCELNANIELYPQFDGGCKLSKDLDSDNLYLQSYTIPDSTGGDDDVKILYIHLQDKDGKGLGLLTESPWVMNFCPQCGKPLNVKKVRDYDELIQREG